MAINCPVCNHDDSIQKISIIVSNGQPSGTISGSAEGVAYIVEKWESVGGAITISRSASIELARKLLPPIEPIKKVGIGCKWIWASVIVVTLFAILIAFATIILLNLNQLMYSSSSTSVIPTGVFPIMAIIGVGVFVFMILPIMGILILWKKYKVSKKEEEEKYIQEKLRWESAMNKWNCAYYCHRDGVVFDNKGITVCQLERFKEFLFS